MPRNVPAALLLMVVAVATAVPVQEALDQHVVDIPASYRIPKSGIWQSFTAGSTGDLMAMDLYVGMRSSYNNCVAFTGDFKLYHGQGRKGVPPFFDDSALIYSAVTVLSCECINEAAENCMSWKRVDLEEPVRMVIGEEYSFSLVSHHDPDAVPQRVGLVVSDGYHRGENNFMAPGYDFPFRSYVREARPVMGAFFSSSSSLAPSKPSGVASALAEAAAAAEENATKHSPVEDSRSAWRIEHRFKLHVVTFIVVFGLVLLGGSLALVARHNASEQQRRASSRTASSSGGSHSTSVSPVRSTNSSVRASSVPAEAHSATSSIRSRSKSSTAICDTMGSSLCATKDCDDEQQLQPATSGQSKEDDLACPPMTPPRRSLSMPLMRHLGSNANGTDSGNASPNRPERANTTEQKEENSKGEGKEEEEKAEEEKDSSSNSSSTNSSNSSSNTNNANKHGNNKSKSHSESSHSESGDQSARESQTPSPEGMRLLAARGRSISPIAEDDSGADDDDNIRSDDVLAESNEVFS